MGGLFGGGSSSSAAPPPPPPPPPAATPPTYASSAVQGKPKRPRDEPFGGTIKAPADAVAETTTATKRLLGD